MTELLWPSMWKWQTTKSLKNLLKTENRPVHPSPNKFFSLPTNLPMTGSLLWCFGLDISTEFYTLAGLLYIYFFFEFLNLIQTTSSFSFGLLERWNASIPVQPRNVPGKQGHTVKHLQWKTSWTGDWLSMQTFFSIITILDSSPLLNMITGRHNLELI